MSLMTAPGVKKYASKYDFLAQIKPVTSLWTLAGIGLVLRLFFLKYRFAVAFDEVNYLKLGVSGYLNGWSEVLHTYWSPLLPGFIKLFCGIFPDYELAARLISVAAGVGVILPVYFLGRMIYDERVGVFAAGFMAIFPPLAFENTLILTESLLILFGAIALVSGLRMLLRYSLGYAFLTGLACGFAYLAHPLGLGFLIVLCGWLVVGHLTRIYLITRLRLAYLSACLIFGFAVVASPYLVFLKYETGAWTVSAKAKANQQMSTPQHDEGSSFRALNSDNTSVPIDLVFHQGTFLQSTNGEGQAEREVKPVVFVTKFIGNLADMLRVAIPGFLGTIPMLLLGAGVFGAGWRVDESKHLLYLCSFLVFYWLILIPAFHIHARYLASMWPICALLVGRGIVNIYSWLRNFMPLTKLTWRKKPEASTLAMVLILGLLFFLTFLPELGRVIARDRDSKEYVADAIEQKKAGEWLKTNSATTPIIMSRNHAVDFYAGNYRITESVTIPTNSLERVLAYARNRNITHLVLNERYVSDYPQLAPLLSGSAPSDALKLVYMDRDVTNLTTVIYQLKDVTN